MSRRTNDRTASHSHSHHRSSRRRRDRTSPAPRVSAVQLDDAIDTLGDDFCLAALAPTAPFARTCLAAMAKADKGRRDALATLVAAGAAATRRAVAARQVPTGRWDVVCVATVGALSGTSPIADAFDRAFATAAGR
jgi:hypothetical protein